MSSNPFTKFREKNNAFKRMLEVREEDPLSGVANLFDVAMVFTAALLVALAVAWKQHPPMEAGERNTDKPELEKISSDGYRLDKYRPTDRELGGEGQRLGTAYQLKSGEVVYVPDSGPAGKP